MEGCMDGDVGWVDAGSIEELKVGDPKLSNRLFIAQV